MLIAVKNDIIKNIQFTKTTNYDTKCRVHVFLNPNVNRLKYKKIFVHPSHTNIKSLYSM